MKKARKQCLGFFGLTLVAAMTIVAAHIPTPGASATSTAVDTITVRVISGAPDVNIRGVENDEVYTRPLSGFSVDYEHIKNMTVTVDYTDAEGNTTTEAVDNAVLDYIAGTKTYKIPQLEANPYAYGKYVIHASGVGQDGVYDEDNVLFYYLPLEAKIEINQLTDKQYVDLDYAEYDGASKDKVAKVLIEVYYENGEVAEPISPLTVISPDKRIEIPFAEKDMPSGIYKLKAYSYNIDGKLLYDPINLTTEYKAAEVPDAGTPDTGGLFQNLNISKEDYLVSGLIVFFVLGIVAFGIVARTKKDSRRHRR